MHHGPQGFAAKYGGVNGPRCTFSVTSSFLGAEVARTTMQTQPPAVETIISSNPRVRFVQTIRDAWHYRELFAAFISRDVKVRYKQTALGVIWVILQPLLAGAVFAAVFGALTGRFSGAEGLLFYMAGLVPWTAFQTGVLMAAASMEANANLVSKVYFPRVVMPGAHAIGAMLDFAIGFVVVLAVALLFGAVNPLLFAFLPLLLAIQLSAAWGIGLFFAALNAQYRDVKYALPFAMQILMMITVLVPLADWSKLLSKNQALAHYADWLPALLGLNPLAGVIETYRALLIGGPIDALLLVKSSVMALILLLAGLQFFSARERRLVDIL